MEFVDQASNPEAMNTHRILKTLVTMVPQSLRKAVSACPLHTYHTLYGLVVEAVLHPEHESYLHHAHKWSLQYCLDIRSPTPEGHA